MRITVSSVLAAIQLAGSATPAFKSLFDQVVDTFGEDDQDVLKAKYAEARTASDAAHDQLQSDLGEAAGE